MRKVGARFTVASPCEWKCTNCICRSPPCESSAQVMDKNLPDRTCEQTKFKTFEELRTEKLSLFVSGVTSTWAANNRVVNKIWMIMFHNIFHSPFTFISSISLNFVTTKHLSFSFLFIPNSPNPPRAWAKQNAWFLSGCSKTHWKSLFHFAPINHRVGVYVARNG